MPTSEEPKQNMTAKPSFSGTISELAEPRGNGRMLSLADQVYARLHEAIITGRLEPGARIVEMAVAAEMGTSQGPVREALQRLESEGLVVRQARSATFVASLSNEELLEIFTVRSKIEQLAIQHLAETITMEQLAQLQQMVEAMCKAGENDDMPGFAHWDGLFHRAICEWSERTILCKALQPLYIQIERFINQNHRKYFSSIRQIAETHLPIIEALSRHDKEQCARAIDEHIMLVWNRVAAT